MSFFILKNLKKNRFIIINMSLPWPFTLIVVIGAITSLFFIIKWVLSEFAHQCPSGQRIDPTDKTKCIPVCDSGQVYRPDTGDCGDCPSGLVKDDTGNCHVPCAAGQTPCKGDCMQGNEICLDTGICPQDRVDKTVTPNVCKPDCPEERRVNNEECCPEDKVAWGLGCCNKDDTQTTASGQNLCCPSSNFSPTDGCCPSESILQDGKCKTICRKKSTNAIVDYCDPATQKCIDDSGLCVNKLCQFQDPKQDPPSLILPNKKEIDVCVAPNDANKWSEPSGPWLTCGGDTWTVTGNLMSDNKCTLKDCIASNPYEGLRSIGCSSDGSDENNLCPQSCVAKYNCHWSTDTKQDCQDAKCPLDPSDPNVNQCCFVNGQYTGEICSNGHVCVQTKKGSRCLPSDYEKTKTQLCNEKNCQNGAGCELDIEAPQGVRAVCNCTDKIATDCYYYNSGNKGKQVNLGKWEGDHCEINPNGNKAPDGFVTRYRIQRDKCNGYATCDRDDRTYDCLNGMTCANGNPTGEDNGTNSYNSGNCMSHCSPNNYNSAWVCNQPANNPFNAGGQNN